MNDKFVVEGVCCGSNGSKCCPYKYICDEEHLTCQLNQTKSFKDEQQFNRCGSTNFICQLNETCCQRSSLNNNNEYACCAFTNVSQLIDQLKKKFVFLGCLL